MPFHKSFPREVPGSAYPKWEEVKLSADEERTVDEAARIENLALLSTCLDDARKLMQEKNLKDYQSDLIHLAIALFEKRASHSVFHKESKAKEKFDA